MPRATSHFLTLTVYAVYAVWCRIVLKDREDAMDALERDPRSLSSLLLAEDQVDALQGDRGVQEGKGEERLEEWKRLEKKSDELSRGN